MKKRLLPNFLLLILLLGSSALPTFAQNIEGNTQDASSAFSKLSAEEQRKIVAGLVKEAETASEGNEIQGRSQNQVAVFFQEYAKKLNIPKVALGMYRWYNVIEDKYPAMGADLSIMLLMSHSIEMLSGPVGVSLSQGADAPAWVSWAIGVGGGIISIPGLDPLCIALGVCYVRWPAFRNGVTQTRIVTMKAVSALGADRFFNGFVQKKERLTFIEEAINAEPEKYSYVVPTSNHDFGLHYDFRNSAGDVFATVGLEIDRERAAYVKEVRYFHHASSEVLSKEFSKMLGLFNYNVSEALAKSFSAFKKGNLSQIESEYHILQFDEATPPGITRIKFRPKTLKLTDQRSWSEEAKKLASCRWLFGS